MEERDWVKTMTTIPPEFQALYKTGEVLQHDICAHLNAWPTETLWDPLIQKPTIEVFIRPPYPPDFADKISRLHDRTNEWFNLIARDFLPYTTYKRDDINLFLRQITLSIERQWIDQDGII